jgi:hypothetical protein
MLGAMMKVKVLFDFIGEEGRIYAGQVVEMPLEKAQHLIESGKVVPEDIETVTLRTSEKRRAGKQN